MNDSQVIDILGGTTKVAQLCQVKPPSVSDWRKFGIPRARRMFLQVIRPDVFPPVAIPPTPLALAEEKGA